MAKLAMAPLIFFSFALSGCATEGKFRANLETWLGHNVDEYIVRAGAPQNQSQLSNGSRLMEWTASSGPIAYSSYNRYSSMTTVGALWCTTRFVVDSSNIIQSYSYQGNYCKSKEGPEVREPSSSPITQNNCVSNVITGKVYTTCY